MLLWVVFGSVLLLIGGMCFARADSLVDFLVPNRSRRDRADADRVLMTITGFRIIAGLLAFAGALLVVGSLVLA